MDEKKPNWLLRSKAYKKATDLVTKTTATPAALQDLVDRAQTKFAANHGGKLGELIESVRATFRLLQAYVKGEYRDISLESLALIVASIIYFVMPLDVIPDFILALGFVDDAALLAWTLKSVASDLQRFMDWESEQNES